MIIQNEYLSDDELQKLISETEADMVSAPPGLKDKIVKSNRPSKKKEYAAYCFRVVTSVAAAIVFIFIMPYLPDFSETGNRTDLSGYENKEIFIKENFELIEYEEPQYPTREEVLNDKSIMRKVLDGDAFFEYGDKETELKDDKIFID